MKPDVVSITESWENESISDAELDIAGYDMFRKDIPTTNKGGGVLLYIRNVLNPSEFHPRSNFPDQVWYKLTAVDRSDVLIGVCYRSNNEEIFGKGCNNDEIKQLMMELRGRRFVMMADINYPGINWPSFHSPVMLCYVRSAVY